MAQYSSKDIGFILIGQFNLLGDLTDVSDKVEALTDEKTVLGDAWHAHQALGVSKASMKQAGFFNDATGASNEALVSSTGTSRVFSYAIEGNTVGKRFIGFQGAMQVGYERIANLTKLHRASAEYRGSGTVDQNGIILHALGARTADGNSEGVDSQDAGAQSAAGAAGYLHVTAYSGFTNVVFKIRDSADDITYVDLMTFATVTAVGAERLTVAGTVDRYLAADWNVTGSGSVTFFIGAKRN